VSDETERDPAEDIEIIEQLATDLDFAEKRALIDCRMVVAARNFIDAAVPWHGEATGDMIAPDHVKLAIYEASRQAADMVARIFAEYRRMEDDTCG
jgi:hypothetical protein